MPVEEDPGVGAIARLKERLSRYETEEGRMKGLAMRPRPSDVLVVTSPKAGTTWMQQITHQIRSKGNIDFDEISCVVPWVELAFDQGQELEAEQAWEPRLFKTHCWYEDCPKGGRYIVVMRNPEDVAVSFFKFFEGWMFEPGEIGLDEFLREFILKRGRPTSPMQNASYWHHMVSWLTRRKDPAVLLLFFEDLKADLKGNVQAVARFMGYKETDADWSERINVATEHSSFAFMSAHGSLFDEHVSKATRNGPMGLPPDAGRANSKVRAGKVGASAAVLSDSLRTELRRKWAEIVEPATGFVDYDDLRSKLSWMGGGAR